MARPLSPRITAQPYTLIFICMWRPRGGRARERCPYVVRIEPVSGFVVERSAWISPLAPRSVIATSCSCGESAGIAYACPADTNALSWHRSVRPSSNPCPTRPETCSHEYDASASGQSSNRVAHLVPPASSRSLDSHEICQAALPCHKPRCARRRGMTEPPGTHVGD